MKQYIAPTSVVVDLENEALLISASNQNFTPGSNSGTGYDPEAASRRGSDWDEYFGR